LQLISRTLLEKLLRYTAQKLLGPTAEKGFRVRVPNPRENDHGEMSSCLKQYSTECIYLYLRIVDKIKQCKQASKQTTKSYEPLMSTDACKNCKRRDVATGRQTKVRSPHYLPHPSDIQNKGSQNVPEVMNSKTSANERNVVLWTDCIEQSPRKANYRSAGLKCANASLLRYL